MLAKYAGALPVWLMPTQVEVIPVANDWNEYGSLVAQKLDEAGVRVHFDDRNETMRYKIREAQLQKIPYMLIVGERDQQNGTVSVRTRSGEDKGAMPADEFVSLVLRDIATKKRD